MTKKFFLISSILIFFLFISSYTFANNDLQKAGNDVKNTVGSAENAVGDMVGGVSGAIKSGTNKVENAGDNMGKTMKNNSFSDSTSNMDSRNGYNATRTSTTFAGMSSTAWTWLILAIAAIAIIALVWLYSAQSNNTSYKQDD